MGRGCWTVFLHEGVERKQVAFCRSLDDAICLALDTALDAPGVHVTTSIRGPRGEVLQLDVGRMLDVVNKSHLAGSLLAS